MYLGTNRPGRHLNFDLGDQSILKAHAIGGIAFSDRDMPLLPKYYLLPRSSHERSYPYTGLIYKAECRSMPHT